MLINFSSEDVNRKSKLASNGSHDTAFFDKKNKIIYLHTHKNASKTIRKVMDAYRGILKTGSAKHEYLRSIDEIPEGYKLFWVVREPIERLVSAFCEIWHIDGFGRANQHVVKDPEVLNKTRHTIDDAFESFVSKIEKHYFDQHVYPQIFTLTHKNLKIEDVDRIILFDNLQEEMITFVNENNIKNWNMELLQVKKGESDMSLKKYLYDKIQNSNELQKRINLLYNEDIEIYKQLQL